MAITGLHPLLVVEASSGFGAIPRLRKTALREFPCCTAVTCRFEIISSDMLIYISNAEIIHFSFVLDSI